MKKGSPVKGWAPLAVTAVLALAALLGWREIFSPDIGTHLGSGRWMLEHGTWPRIDPFVYGLENRPYIDLYWLYQVCLWSIFRTGGTVALVTTTIGLTFTACGLLLWRCRQRDGKVSAWCAPVLFLFVLGNLWEIRPHIISWILLGAMLLALESYHRGRRRALCALPVIMVLWVNCHSMFILGLGVLAICIPQAMWSRPGDRKTLAIWSGAALLACLVNPYGLTGLLFPFRELVQFRQTSLFMAGQTGIAELLSPFGLKAYTANRALVLFQPLLFMQAYAAVSLIGFAANGRRLRGVDVVFFAAFFGMFAQSQKMFGYYVVATFPLVVSGWECLGVGVLRKMEGRFGPRAGAALRLASPVALALACAVVGAQVLSGYLYARERVPHRFGHGFNREILPVRACEFIASQLPRGRLLNSFGYGGYAGFATRNKVLVDGRTDIVGPAFYAEYLQLFEPKRLPSLLVKWKPDIALVSIGGETAWLAHLANHPKWRWVYADEQDAVFVRRGFASDVPNLPPPEARRDFPVFAGKDTDDILTAALSRREPEIVDTMIRPQCYPLAGLRWCGSYLLRGYPQAALGHGLEGLRQSTFPVPDLLNNVMQAFIAMGDYRRALRCYEALPPQFQDPQLKRRLLQALPGQPLSSARSSR